MPELPEEIKTNSVVDVSAPMISSTFLQSDVELTPQLQNVSNSIKAQNNPQAMLPSERYNLTSGQNIYDIGADTRIQTQRPEIPFTDVYEQLNSGEFIPRFENYIPGINNEEYLAQRQTTGEKWKNGLSKFIGKTTTAILGGTVGVVDSVINGVSEQSMSAAYSSNFNQWLDDLNTKMDYNLPNYYTEQEKNKNFVGSLGTANFWANDVLGGLSFTVGAIVSEGIWAYATGGTSLLAKGIGGNIARGVLKAGALNTAKAEGKTLLRASAREGIDQFLKRGEAVTRGVQMANTARFLATSAGYEAGVEARHYIKETTDRFIEQFERSNGRKPNSSEMAVFENDLTSAANAVFATNVGLVGSSNLAIFGRLALGKPIRNKISQNILERTLFGKGFERVGEGAYKALKPTSLQKTLGRVYGIGKPMFTEGFYEEGLQGVTSTTAEDYILSKYDTQSTNDSIGIMDSMYEGFSNTFGSKEGFKEVGIGAIIGLLGGGFSSIASGQGLFNEVGAERQQIEDFVEYRNSMTNQDAANMLIERLKTGNVIQSTTRKKEEAQDDGDYTGEVMADSEAMVASIEKDILFQGREEGIRDFTTALDIVNNQQLADELGIPVIDIEAWKQNKIDEYTALSAEHEKNLRYSASLLGNTEISELKKAGFNKLDLERAIAMNLTMSKQADNLAFDLADNIRKIVSEYAGVDSEAVTAISTAEVTRKLDQTNKQAAQQYTKASEDLAKSQAELEALQNQLVRAQYTQQEAAEQSTALNLLQQKVIEQEERVNTLTERKDLAFNALNINSLSGEGEVVTQEMLDNQVENVRTLKSVTKSLEKTNPQLYATLSKLFNEYEKAVAHTINFNKTIGLVVDEKTRLTELNGWVSRILKKNRSLEKPTAEVFTNILREYQRTQSGATTQAKSLETKELIERGDLPLTDEAYSKFKNEEGAPVTQAMLDNLINKKKAGKTFTEKEQEIYNAKITEEEASDGIDEAVEERAEREPETVIGNLKKRISDILNEGEYGAKYFGDDPSQLTRLSPSKKDVDRFNTLLKKIVIDPQSVITNPYNEESGLTENETKEFVELNTKLNNWKTLQGTTYQGGDSVADLLELLALKEREFSKTKTKSELDNRDYLELQKAEDKEAASSPDGSQSTIISPDNVLVKITSENGTRYYNFSHLNIESLLRLVPSSELYTGRGKAFNTLTESWKRKNLKKTGQVFELRQGENRVRFTIGDNAQLRVSEDQFNTLNSNIKILSFGTSNYNSVYQKISDTELIPLTGDFTYDSDAINEIIQFNPEKVYSLRNEQVLRTTVNKNDSYNRYLKAEYDAGRITREELANKLHIYVAPQDAVNEIIGSLRAQQGKQSNSDAATNLNRIRTAATDKFLSEETANSFDVGRTVRVRFTLFGNPNIEVVEDAEGNLIPNNIDFSKEAISQIVDVGYIQNNEIKSQKNLQLNPENTIFVRAISNKEAKTPIVVFNYKNRRIAFPVALKKIAQQKGAQLTTIINPASALTPSQQAIQAEILLRENNLDPDDYNLDPTRDDWYRQDGITRAVNDLDNIEDFVDVETWLNTSYDFSRLQREAEIAIDIANKPFHGGKTILNLSDVEISEVIPGEFEAREDDVVDIEKRLSRLAIEIDRDWRTNTAYENIIEGGYAELLDNNEMIQNPTQHIDDLHNLTVLRAALSRRIPQAVQNYIGDQIQEARNLINQLDRAKETRTEIKNASVQKEVENQNTSC